MKNFMNALNEELEAEVRRELLLTSSSSSDDENDENELKNKPNPKQPKDPSSMTSIERLILSPWEKWMQLFDAQNAAYIRASHRNWAFFFLPPTADNGVVPRFQRDLYTINRTMTAVRYLRDSYFSIGITSVANYEYLRTYSGHIQPVKLTVGLILPHGEMEMREYLVAEDDENIGPFDSKMTSWQQKHLIRSLQFVKFSFPLRDRQFGHFYEECFEWHVNVGFQVIESARIHVQLEDSEVLRCVSMHPRSFWAMTRQTFVWMHVIVVVVVLLYMTLSLRALWKSLRVMARARRLLLDHSNETYEKSDDGLYYEASADCNVRRLLFNARQRGLITSWAEFPFSLKLYFINSLQVLVLTSLVLLFSSTMWSLCFLEAHMPIRFWHRLLHATALLLLWSCFVGYLEHNQHIYSIVLTLKWGTPRVLQFLLGVSPFFVGYALFGTIYFGNKIDEFGTLSASMITLFSLMNGDSIMDTFDAMDLHHFIISGRVYLYSFISLFMYVVLNIFIAIVEEAFFATQSTRRRLSDYLSAPRVFRVAKESDISAEMAHAILRLIDLE
ncbi:unnamed protein product [Peronospora belbahrii]|uniref:Polycystin cation channel PKD1/PKD2 domain-containing protein n=1 Tax=Peronospora belbahrii TaxID=622444 RepID=A0ABN8D0I3_9STRA|nr:unnamed protein product [Peronospora belbahrii]